MSDAHELLKAGLCIELGCGLAAAPGHAWCAKGHQGQQCEVPECIMPVEVYGIFTMELVDRDTPEGLTDLVEFEKVRCLTGHHYVREMAFDPEGMEELDGDADNG